MTAKPLLWALWAGSALLGGAEAQNVPAPGAEPAIRATASEVLLDVVVRDKHGKPVRNLKPTDIQVLENGIPRELKSFRYVGAREAQTRATAAGARSAQAPAASHPLRAVNLICIVLHNIDPSMQSRAIEAVQEFLKNELPPDSFAGLFLLDDAITPIAPFTKDRAELSKAAANAFRLHGLDFAQASEAVYSADPMQVIVDTVTDTVAHTSTTTVRIAGGQVPKTVITGAEVNTAPGANIMRGVATSERRDFLDITGARATDQIETMLDRLGPLPGRKTVLLVSSGLLTNGDPDRFEKLLAKANQSKVTVYAMDVAGLSHVSSSQAGDLALGQVAAVSRTQTAIGGSLQEAKEKSRQGDTMNMAVRSSDSEAALRELSESTGGFLIANTNEYRKPFQQIVDGLEAHYEVSYRPSADTWDGGLRKIEVKLSKPDLRAESRTGYFAMPDLKGAKPLAPHEVFGLAVLNAKPRPHSFDFDAGVFDFRDGHELLAFQLPGSAFTATPQPGRGVHLLRPSLTALVKDSRGEVVDEYSMDAPYEAPDANLKAIQAAAFTYTHQLILPPGRYTLETAVIDRQGGRASTGERPFEIAEPPAGISMSSVVLVQNIEDAPKGEAPDPLTLKNKRVVPYVGSALKAEAKPYAYFVVYPDRSSKDRARLRVEFRAGDTVLADQTSDLPPADSSGAAPMIIRAANHPGACELRITAMQGGRSTTRTLRYTVTEPRP